MTTPTSLSKSPTDLLLAAKGLLAFIDDLDATHCGLEDFTRNYPGLPDAIAFARNAILWATPRVATHDGHTGQVLSTNEHGQLMVECEDGKIRPYHRACVCEIEKPTAAPKTGDDEPRDPPGFEGGFADNH